MDFEKEARALRAKLPGQASFNPPPMPYVGHINLIRRRDGGYMVAAIGADGQAGQLEDGTLAVSILDGSAVRQTGPEDPLAATLRLAHRQLMQLRVEAALRLAAKLGRELYDDHEELHGMLREALAQDQW